jgi:hypothetical protein
MSLTVSSENVCKSIIKHILRLDHYNNSTYTYMSIDVTEVIMTQYHKMISLKGDYYLKEYETIKNHKNKIRYLREETVSEVFKKGEAEIVVHFEDSTKVITIDYFSDSELIKKYLGPKFVLY